MRDSVAPVMRIADVDRAVAWYSRLGFRLVGEHRDEPDVPAYVFVARGDVWLHLSQHEGDARPGSLRRRQVVGVAFGVGAERSRFDRGHRPRLQLACSARREF